MTSIKVFSTLIEMRAGPLAGHSRRVADLARRMAERMGLSRAAEQDVMLAGLLHDIGKIGFPDALMTKPMSQLAGDELDLLKKHPTKGSTTLMPLEELHNAAQLIRHQHERYDGQGFPDKLSGSDIPEGSRILALVNDYDAAQLGLRLPRKLSPEEAREWIIKGKGSRYAPNVVDAFLDLVGRPHHSNFKESKVSSRDLIEGMVLERDLLTHDGVLLLGANHVLDNALIRQIHEVEASEKTALQIWIRCL